MVFNSTKILENGKDFDDIVKRSFEGPIGRQHLDPSEIGNVSGVADQPVLHKGKFDTTGNVSIIIRDGPICDTSFGHPDDEIQVVSAVPIGHDPGMTRNNQLASEVVSIPRLDNGSAEERISDVVLPMEKEVVSNDLVSGVVDVVVNGVETVGNELSSSSSSVNIEDATLIYPNDGEDGEIVISEDDADDLENGGSGAGVPIPRDVQAEPRFVACFSLRFNNLL